MSDKPLEYKSRYTFWIHPEDQDGLILPNSDPEIVVEIKYGSNFGKAADKVVKCLQKSVADHREMLARYGLSE